MPGPRLLLLGPPLFERDGHSVELTSHKAIALLGYLAVAGMPVPRERLQALLWPESLPEAAQKNLRNHLWIVRQTLGDHVVRADGPRLALGPGV